MRGYIYTLSTNGTVRYVGQTIHPTRRFKQHLREARSTRHAKYRKNRWINKSLRLGIDIEFEVLDIVAEEELDYWECYYIELMKSWGFDLTNTALGGKGGKPKNCHSEETLQKLRESGFKTAVNRWRQRGYNEDQITSKLAEAVAKSKAPKPLKNRKMVITQVTTTHGQVIGVFKSMKEASSATGVPAKRIQEIVSGRTYCKGKKIRRSSKGLVFKRLN